MSVSKLDIYAVRNIQQQSISPSPAINLIVGDNASGKSALIEAIFILGRAKSFRCSAIKSVINFKQSHLVVSAQTEQANGSRVQLGIQMDGKMIEIHINQQAKQNRSDLAYALPLQLIHPKSYELLDGGSQLRREFLDWGVFNHDQNFLPVWRRFKKALSQRNALLKTRRLEQLNVWDKELVYYGTIVDGCRQRYLETFKPVFSEIIGKFIAVEGLDLKLVSGWDLSRELGRVLMDDRDKDLRYGFTHSGPHRGDFQLLINNRLAKDVVSRGQLKLLVMSLKLAQVQLLADEQNQSGCLLVDDFAAELDAINRAKLLRYLADMACQVFITATEIQDFGDLSQIKDYKMFHVEHGTIKPV
ncbi:MAG: DNA replication/repair protein RecF [Methylobacter sp.]|nr:DNA replication/repair protein RecF [Methylobacter sp.]MDP2100084.1 DNA replication/repair protein RecF [Methylobacter sp.]MDP2427699.1 DNA replication/repair protein RecF [Methylobacter sp.]MDP3055101.1 DNA replication/repair protein RecF [Methylobacter sp.]MDP3360950.1 DNA replication/repair protein RecF [Methylobacter sp.]